MKCIDECRLAKKACSKKECRMWLDHAADLNCTYETVRKNGSLSLREAAKRLNISFVRVKQIEDEALSKLMKALRAQTGLEEEYLRELLICE